MNKDGQKYKITVDGDKIVTEVKWMDAVLFSPSAVTDEMREFKFIVQVNDDGTWSEIDESKQVSKRIGAGGLSMNYSSFRGKQISFNKTVAIGKNRDDAEVGIVNITFNSEEYKKPVRDYLTANGFKKESKGFFKRLFKK
ncbi:MAG: hypothetical protein IJY93_07630 [Clostridia bacterium]|nr:hypothetical protein [Clostridia bacterium]